MSVEKVEILKLNWLSNGANGYVLNPANPFITVEHSRETADWLLEKSQGAQPPNVNHVASPEDLIRWGFKVDKVVEAAVVAPPAPKPVAKKAVTTRKRKI